VFEALQKFADAPLTVHEGCGGTVERLISAPAFHLKGTGWYATDYAKGSGGAKGEIKHGEPGKGDSSGESKSGESKSGDSKSAESKSSGSESKSDSKTDSKSSDKAESKSDTKTESKSESKPAPPGTKRE
jgi:putative FmdB family regulatory protein